MLLYESDYKKICVMPSIERRPIVLLLHACRQLPGHTNDNRQADRVTDIKKIDNTPLCHSYIHGLIQQEASEVIVLGIVAFRKC